MTCLPLSQMQFMGIMQSTNSTLCLDNLEGESRLVAILQLHIYLLSLGDHFMLQIPSGTPTELCDHDVAVAEEVDVEISM